MADGTIGADGDLARRAIAILGDLVAFDTTSHRSNLGLIAWIERYLGDLGVASARVPDAAGVKSNLLATIGPMVDGGVALSGHTDVVPVVGQPWASDPFLLTRRDDRLYGRGTCDMKGFLALALAAVPDLLAASLRRPAHLAFSYDEEIGCLGAPSLIAAISALPARPALVLIGEPTSLNVVSAHKGIFYYEVTVRGREAHSSQPHLGVSAIRSAVRLMACLEAIAERLEGEADPASPFDPKWATLTIGTVNGGTATNILALDCRFVFDLRSAAGSDPGEILRPFFDLAAREDLAIKARAPDGGVTVRMLADVPAFEATVGGPGEVLARRLAGDNGPVRTVSFGTEDGQFRNAGFETILCGPGSIDQAHQPDEYVEISQIERGAAMMSRLAAELSRA